MKMDVDDEEDFEETRDLQYPRKQTAREYQKVKKMKKMKMSASQEELKEKLRKEKKAKKVRRYLKREDLDKNVKTCTNHLDILTNLDIS